MTHVRHWFSDQVCGNSYNMIANSALHSQQYWSVLIHGVYGARTDAHYSLPWDQTELGILSQVGYGLRDLGPVSI